MTLADLMPSATEPPITVKDMLDRKKLITLPEAREVLALTEPLAQHSFDTGPSVRFRVSEDRWDPEWFKNLDPSADVPVLISLNQGGDASEFQLSKDAVIQAAAFVPGMSASFVENMPGFLVEDVLNHWYRGGLDKSLQLLTVGDRGRSIARETLVPFSNLAMLDSAVAALTKRYEDLDLEEVYVDGSKLAHSLRQTYLQLVIPGLSRVMENTGELDDRWWGGVQIANSLSGASPTGVEGFMFRQRCTNGMIECSGSGSSWSRRGAGGNSAEDAYEWAKGAVDDVLGGLEASFDKVQALVSQNVEGEVGSTLEDIFEAHSIPKRASDRILELMIESDQLNMYALTNAVTEAANSAETAREQQLLMRAGGDVVEHGERCTSCHRLSV